MLFDEEKIEEGVTLRVYRFETTKPYLSIVVRMSGPKTDIGNEVIGPIRKEIKEAKLKALKDYATANPQTWWKKRKPEAAQNLQRLQAIAGGDPFMDIERFQGEQVVARIVMGLKEKGLSEKSVSRRSNGDLDEEIHLYA